MSYVDLHLHLLPGIDDGARATSDALGHAGRLAAEGVRDVACTPHVKRAMFPRVRLPELAERRRALQAAIDAEGLELRLHAGGELAHDDALELAPDELALIAQGPPGARWLLLECPFEGIGDDFGAAAERLARLGYGLLLAHPERAPSGHEGLWPLLDAGARAQVNVCSLMGNNGPAARALGAALVRDGRAHCLASDGHPGTREHTLAAGFELALRAGATIPRARALTQGNPLALLREGLAPPAVGRRLAA
jgi:protein-tyrosine phosphatase